MNAVLRGQARVVIDSFCSVHIDNTGHYKARLVAYCTRIEVFVFSRQGRKLNMEVIPGATHRLAVVLLVRILPSVHQQLQGICKECSEGSPKHEELRA